MNDHLQQHLTTKSSELSRVGATLSPLTFKDLGAVPKTPMQRFVHTPQIPLEEYLFWDLVMFIERHIRILQDPVFGDICYS